MNSLQQHIDDTYFMRIALQEAQKAYDSHEVPVGAVVVSDRKIIARAHNQVECLKDATAHAEMLALSAAFNHLGGKYLRNCTLYVTLEPCLMCASATFWAKLSRLVFAASDSKLGYTTYHPFNPLHPQTKTDAGILQQASNQVLKTFFKNLRK
jgi:tRNA(adenine34) deaminase